MKRPSGEIAKVDLVRLHILLTFSAQRLQQLLLPLLRPDVGEEGEPDDEDDPPPVQLPEAEEVEDEPETSSLGRDEEELHAESGDGLLHHD